LIFEENMKPTEYEKNVLITESNDFPAIKNRIDDRMVRLLHASLGWNSELSELVDAVWGEGDIDYVNVSEEIGDLLWYTSVATNALGLDPVEISSGEKEHVDANLSTKDEFSLETAVAAVVWASGEFNDLVKKHLLYGKEFNIEKAKIALRSLHLSMAGVCYVCETTPDKIRQTNISKLQARFGEKFTEAAALNRNLEIERRILEEGAK
jgi:hypothetical protein